MIDDILFTNVNGESIALNDDIIHMTQFESTVEDRTTERDKSEQHGLWPAATYLGKRIIRMEGDICCDTSAEYLDKRRLMKRVFTPRPQFGLKYTGTLAALWSGYSDYVTIQCTTDGDPDLPIAALSPSRTPYMLNLKAFDPRWYGPLKQSTLFPPAGSLGRSYGKVFPLTYAAEIGAHDILVTNAGDIETYPIVEIHGPCTGPQLILFRSDGQVFVVTASSLVLSTINDYVTIDLGLRTAVMNTGQNVYSYTDGSQWWALEPGSENTVRYSAATYDPASYALFKWRDAYMF